MRKFLACLLVCGMVLGLVGPWGAVAAETPAEAMARELYDMGLFKGKGTLPDGSPNFALADRATRAEAATMLIRLLGKESKATAQWGAGVIRCPFPDLDRDNFGWAKANVTWLYEHDYTNGTSATAYTGGSYVDLQQFCAFILRALDYSEGTGDFTWRTATDFAQSIGLITAQQRERFTQRFDRGSMVEMCYRALGLTMRDSKRTLKEKLTYDHVLTRAGTLAPANTALGKAGAVTLTQKYEGGGADFPWYAQEATSCAPVAVDLNGDGRQELLFGARTIYCLDGATGNVLWKVNSGKDRSQEWVSGEDFGETNVTLRVLDVDGDGKLEIVTMNAGYAAGKSCLAVYTSEGYFESGWPQYTTHVARALQVADMDRDGRMELCVGLGVGAGSAPSLYVYDAAGTVRPGWPVVCGYGVFSNTFGTADLDGDGDLELLLLYDDQYINAYHHNGTPVVAQGGIYQGLRWNGLPVCETMEYETVCTEWARGHGGIGSPASDWVLGNVREMSNAIGGTYGGMTVADLDGNGTNELIFGAMVVDGRTIMRSGTNSFEGSCRYFTTFILNTDRTRYTNAAKGFDWTQFPTDPGRPETVDPKLTLPMADNTPVTADVDGDGNQEILYSANDGLVHCWHLDGTEHGAWPYDLDPRSSGVTAYATRPVCADVNGDGRLEVIFASYTDREQTQRGHIYVLDYTGRVLADQVLPERFYAPYEDCINGCRTQPCVADLDGDGKYEIALNTLYAGIVVYDIG